MGDIKRKRKKYGRPRVLYDKARIEQENEIVRKYGLKNKKSIWKADARVSILRKRAKLLIPRPEEEKKEFFERLNKLGFKVSIIADVLALTKEDWLNRRLQTIVFRKGLSKTIKEARQLIVHKQILVDGKAVNTPSYMVTTDSEENITLKTKPKSKQKEGEQNE
mgnify:CR=1 FL=1